MPSYGTGKSRGKSRISGIFYGSRKSKIESRTSRRRHEILARERQTFSVVVSSSPCPRHESSPWSSYRHSYRCHVLDTKKRETLLRMMRRISLCDRYVTRRLRRSMRGRDREAKEVEEEHERERYTSKGGWGGAWEGEIDLWGRDKEKERGLKMFTCGLKF